MACSKEGLEISDGSLCGICSEKHNIARRKLACGHTFCENCLFTFVFDLKENGKIDSTFQCPVCGTVQPLEETGKITLEWIQTFPLATDVTESDMDNCDAVSDLPDEGEETIKCGPCVEEGHDIPGNKYCLECEAHLCDACVAAHKKFKLFRSHTLLDLSEILDNENVLTDLQKLRKCQKHPDRDVELFCNDDDIFICLLCASTSHKKCTNVVEASECSAEIEQNANHLKERIDETQKHLHVLHQLLVVKVTSIQAQTDTFVSEITDIKHEIVNSLETIVENACVHVTQLRQDIQDKDKGTAADIERIVNVLKNKLMYIDALSKYGNSPELLRGCTQLKDELEIIEKEVLVLDKGFETADVNKAIVEKLKHVSLQLNDIPDVSIINKASNHEPKYSPLLEKPSSPFAIQSVECHTVRLVQGCTPTFTGLSVKENGHLLLCDSCNENAKCGYVCDYSQVEKTKQLMKLRHAYNATELNTHTLALTMKSDKKILVVTLGLERKEKSLTTKYQPRSIVAMKDGNVAISWTDPPGFSIADISGTTIQESQYLNQDSDGRKFWSFEYMAIDEARQLVIQPCHVDDAVYGFTFTGKPVFKYTNNLVRPRGVAVDSKSGSVFVCDLLDHSIHQLSVRADYRDTTREV